jgi:hypothetical protein
MATFVVRAQSILSGPLRQALALLGSVIVVSTLISFLVSSATRDATRSASVVADTEATGIVLGEHFTAEETAPAPEAPPPDNDASISPSSQATPPNQAKPQAAPPFKGTMPVTLEIRATDEVWVLVTLDGKDVLDATLEPGASHIFQGQWVAGLRVGNAAGLQVFWNGKDIGRMGREGQVRRLYFTRDDVGAGAPPDPASLSGN